MVRAYDLHGRESGCVAQITCDTEMEADFLRLMRKARILILPQRVDPLELLPDNPATGTARKKVKLEHLVTIRSQWQQCAEAAKKHAHQTTFRGTPTSG